VYCTFAYIEVSAPTQLGCLLSYSHGKTLFLSGFTFWDAVTYAPFGRPIYYPPLFHVLLGLMGQIFNGDFFFGARVIQPILAFGVVFSFTYLAYRVYGLSVSFISGFLIIMSLTFHRFMLPIPESLALIFFSLSLCSYYLSLQNGGVKYGVTAGILAGIGSFNPSFFLRLSIITVVSVYCLLLRLSENAGEDYNLLIYSILFICLLMLLCGGYSFIKLWIYC
jgi:hypothetical protein